MEDLQQWNLVECITRMAPVPGWEVLRAGALVAVKSPARRPLGNFAWGPVTAASLEAGQAFFHGRPHSWLLPAGQDASLLLAAGYQPTDPSPELVFDLSRPSPAGPAPGTRVTEPAAPGDLLAWTELVATNFHLTVAEAEEFFLPLISRGVCTPVLALQSGRPAATALLFPAGGTAGIYAVGTRADLRGRGLGRVIMAACLDRARDAGMDRAVLYASVMGRPFYERLGFTTAQVLDEYCTASYPVSI